MCSPTNKNSHHILSRNHNFYLKKKQFYFFLPNCATLKTRPKTKDQIKINLNLYSVSRPHVLLAQLVLVGAAAVALLPGVIFLCRAECCSCSFLPHDLIIRDWPVCVCLRKEWQLERQKDGRGALQAIQNLQCEPPSSPLSLSLAPSSFVCQEKLRDWWKERKWSEGKEEKSPHFLFPWSFLCVWVGRLGGGSFLPGSTPLPLSPVGRALCQSQSPLPEGLACRASPTALWLAASSKCLWLSYCSDVLFFLLQTDREGKFLSSARRCRSLH